MFFEFIFANLIIVLSNSFFKILAVVVLVHYMIFINIHLNKQTK